MLLNMNAYRGDGVLGQVKLCLKLCLAYYRF